jgi:PAS domain S-box-containing protein
LLGYDPGELQGRRVEDLVEPADLDAWLVFARDLQARPRVALRGRVRCRHRDGTLHWMEGAGQNLLDEPTVRAVVIRMRESTARRRLEPPPRKRRMSGCSGG